MLSIALDGFWLLGALVAVYITGVFTAQWAKDRLTGVPAALRAALKVNEAAALAELKNARDKIVAETANLFAKGKAAVAADAKAAVAAVVPAAAPVAEPAKVEPVAPAPEPVPAAA